MKKHLLTFIIYGVLISICLNQLSVIFPSAASIKIQDDYKFIKGETYAFRDAFELAVKDLDADKKEKTKFDDTPWNATIDLYFPVDGSIKRMEGEFTYRDWDVENKKIWASNLRGLSYKISAFDNHHATIEWNVEDKSDKNIYVSAASGWKDTDVIISLNFTAPKGGKIVLYDTFDKSIDACINEPLNAFLWQNAERNGYTFSIFKNDKKLWPADKDGILMNKNNPSIPFPDLGEIEVKKGDVITIKVIGVTYPNGQFFTINPEVGYTSFKTDKPQNDNNSKVENSSKVETNDENIDTTTSKEDVPDKNDSQTNENPSINTDKQNDVTSGKNDILIVGLIVGGVILLVGGVVVVVIIKKIKV